MTIQAAEIAIKLHADIAEVSKNINKVQRDFKRSFKAIEKTGQSLTRNVSVPLGGIGLGVLKMAGDFEKAMKAAQAVTGATGDQIQLLSKKAQELGSTTKFSASEAANAIEVLGKNGLKVDQVLGGALDASLNLAAATGTDLSTAADIATDAMLQFGISAKDMSSVVNGATGVTLSSKISIEDYGNAIAQAGGIAGSLGVEFDDFNAALAGTASQFKSGSDAGTSFKTFIQRLVPESKGAREAMDELGLQFFDLEGNMKSIPDIAENLKTSLAGLSEEGKNEALKTLFGSDATRTAIGLMEQGREGIENLKTSIADTSAADQAKIRMEGLNGAMTEFKSAIEGAAIAIGESGLVEWATGVAKGVTEVVRNLSQASPEVLKIGTISAGAAVAGGPLILFFGMVVKNAISLYGAASKLFLLLRAHPFVAIATALTGLATYIYQNRDAFIALGKSIGENIDSALKVVEKFADEAVKAFGEFVKSGVQIATDFIDGFIAGINSRITSAVKSITDFADKVSGGFKDFFKIKSPSKLMQEYGVNLGEGLALGISESTSIPVKAAEKMAEDTAKAFDDMAERTRQSIEEVSGELETSTNDFELFGGSVGEVLVGVSDGSIDFKDSLISSFKDIIANGIDALLKSLFDLKSFDWSNIFSGKFDFSGLIGKLTGGLSGVVSSIGNVLTGGLGGVVSKIGGIFSGGFSSVLTSAAGIAQSAGSAILGSLGGIAAAAGPIALTAAAVYGLTKVFGGGRSAAEIMADEVQGLTQTIANGTSEVFNLAGGFEAAGAAGSHFITGQNLDSLQEYLNGIEGINTRLQEVDGKPVLRVLDEMGRGVVELDDIIKDHADSMTGEFKEFGAQASAAGDGIRDSYIKSTGKMTQAVAGLGVTSNTVSGQIITAFNTSGIKIETASKAAALVMKGEFTQAAGVLRHESTGAASELRSQLEAAARAASGSMSSFASSSVADLLRIISEANKAASAVASIGTASSGGGSGERSGGFAKGGIANGPLSGYQITLHGREMILPPDVTRFVEKHGLIQQGQSQQASNDDVVAGIDKVVIRLDTVIKENKALRKENKSLAQKQRLTGTNG